MVLRDTDTVNKFGEPHAAVSEYSLPMSISRHIVVVDPAVRVAEIDCLNRMALVSPLPLTYHLPGLVGLDSLRAERAGIAGIVVLGSGTSVYDSRPWQRPLEEWILPLMEKGVPTLGLCYGHQMIAHLFGGEVRFVHDDKRKNLGMRRVRLDADRLWGPACEGELFVSHRETVSRCPDAMKVVGRSDLVATDVLAHHKLPVWSFQPHPEATQLFVRGSGATEGVSDMQLAFGWRLVDAFLALCHRAS